MERRGSEGLGGLVRLVGGCGNALLGKATTRRCDRNRGVGNRLIRKRLSREKLWRFELKIDQCLACNDKSNGGYDTSKYVIAQSAECSRSFGINPSNKGWLGDVKQAE